MQDTSYTDSFVSITGTNINFNNNAGLLSSMAQAQLYKASAASGLKNTSGAELSGSTSVWLMPTWQVRSLRLRQDLAALVHIPLSAVQQQQRHQVSNLFQRLDPS